MKSQQAGPIDKIRYRKPAVVDLGPTASIVGGSCVPGDTLDEDKCYTVGNSAGELCDTGNAAAGTCIEEGNSPVEGCEPAGSTVF